MGNPNDPKDQNPYWQRQDDLQRAHDDERYEAKWALYVYVFKLLGLILLGWMFVNTGIQLVQAFLA